MQGRPCSDGWGADGWGADGWGADRRGADGWGACRVPVLQLPVPRWHARRLAVSRLPACQTPLRSCRCRGRRIAGAGRRGTGGRGAGSGLAEVLAREFDRDGLVHAPRLAGGFERADGEAGRVDSCSRSPVRCTASARPGERLTETVTCWLAAPRAGLMVAVTFTRCSADSPRSATTAVTSTVFAGEST